MNVRLFHPAVVLCLAGVFLALSARATHNRAGEIIYEHLSGFTYRVTIITYTKASAPADRPWLKIRWGDEAPETPDSQLDSLPRVVEDILVGLDVKHNEYVGEHTYAGPGIFNLVVEDPNRNSGVVNIEASVSQIFCITSQIVISPETGHNDSVQLLNPPIQQACIFQPWVHNPAAYDPDGDSLAYSLIPCMGAGCEPLPGWAPPQFATEYPLDIFTIDPQTGTVSWEVPPLAGEYNIAILIREYRDGFLVGSVVRDMQITVITCANEPPVIADLDDYCIEAGDFLSFPVIANDPNGDGIDIEAYGGPLTNVIHEAEWNGITNFFSWSPECEEIRLQPYTVVFNATDDGYVNLTDIETVNIRVVAPRVENPVATPEANSIVLTWDIHECAPIFNSFTGSQVRYKIYRRNGLFNFDPAECELGVPAYTGYSYIGEVQGVTNTTYTDNTVFYGGNYCYMIVTCWPDGAESYASEEFCAELRKDVPVMTMVSVGVTSESAGVDTIGWSPPTELDTLIFTGPYQYRLYHNTGFSGADELIYQSSTSPFLIWGDTTYVHEDIPTQSVANAYRVEFFSNGELVASSSTASSVYLQLSPGDNSMQLDFLHDLPWTNTSYDIYRKAPGETEFSLLAVTTEPSYIDTGLVNNQSYCYVALATGTYFAEDVPDPLLNWSQEACAQPYDQTPPCPPVLTISSDCGAAINELVWTNPNSTCTDDVTGYTIYYAPVEGQPLQPFLQVDEAGDTTYFFNAEGDLNSIAGCFAVTALDSLNLWPDGNFYQNESALSNIICVDNCPQYFLPNIFTPNGDGANDLFVPFEYRYVQDIDLKIFNRWGMEVFRTTDPDIRWNGTAAESGALCTDGVYYYTITVNTIRLSGIVAEKFSGTIQLQDGRSPVSTE